MPGLYLFGHRSQLKKIGVLEDQLTAISNASQRYDRAEWVKKKDELSRECHCTEDVHAAIEAADAFGMHVADAARAEAYRDNSGLMLSALHNKIQQDVTCPLLQPILGEAAVAAGQFAEEVEQKEKAEAERTLASVEEEWLALSEEHEAALEGLSG